MRKTMKTKKEIEKVIAQYKKKYDKAKEETNYEQEVICLCWIKALEWVISLGENSDENKIR